MPDRATAGLSVPAIAKCGFAPDMNGEYSAAHEEYRQGYAYSFTDNFVPDPAT